MNAIDRLRAKLETLTDPQQRAACEQRLRQYEHTYARRRVHGASRSEKVYGKRRTLLRQLRAAQSTITDLVIMLRQQEPAESADE